MDDDKLWWAPVLGAGVLVMMFFSLALIAAAGWSSFIDFLNGRAAEWVQAIGSIAAILFAYGLGVRQMVAARMLETDKQRATDVLRAEVLRYMYEQAGALCNALGGLDDSRIPAGPHTHRAIAQIADLEQAFRSVPPFEIPSRGIASGVLAAPYALRNLIDAARRCIDERASLMGQDVPIGSRFRVEFQRAYEQAVGVCKTGVGICEAQIRAFNRHKR